MLLLFCFSSVDFWSVCSDLLLVVSSVLLNLGIWGTEELQYNEMCKTGASLLSMKLSWLYFVTFDSYKEGTVSSDGCKQRISLHCGVVVLKPSWTWVVIFMWICNQRFSYPNLRFIAWWLSDGSREICSSIINQIVWNLVWYLVDIVYF